MEIITTSIHTSTDNGFLPTYSTECTILHQGFTEIPQRRQQCYVTRLEDAHHEFHSAPGLSSITTFISCYKQIVQGGKRGKNEERSEGSNKEAKKNGCCENTGKTVEVCFSKNVTVWVITGDVSSLRESGVNTVQYVKVTTANICSLNHGAAGSADIPICPLCHWSKLAFMRLPSMQFIAVLNKASSVYNPMLFPQTSNCRLTLPSRERLRKRTLLAETHGPKCGSTIKYIQKDLYWHVCWKITS